MTPRRITVALAGNPNAGKTTIFNALTGARQHVGNWPGVTVEKKEGTLNYGEYDVHVVDLPGTYSLTAFSLEEIIARQFIVEGRPDVVIDVVDAANLERNLYLCVQLLEMGAKLVLALNMIDVAQGRGISINVERLSQLLGVPVVPTNGKKGIGIQELLDAVVKVAQAPHDTTRRRVFLHYGTELEEELEQIEYAVKQMEVSFDGLDPRWIAIKLLEGDPAIAQKFTAPDCESVLLQVEASRKHIADIFDDPAEIVLADARYGFVSGALKQSVRIDPGDRVHWSDRIDSVLTHKLLGPIILAFVLYGVYAVTFGGSEPLVKALESGFKWFGSWVTEMLPDGLLRSLLVSGIIDGVGGVLGFTPLIAFMFLAIAFLEDTGYMARIAFMLDRVLRGFGLHGASMLALMVSGGIAGGCAVPGIMATRTLKEPKERLATILVAPLMNCGAKLPVYALLIGAFFEGSKAQIMFLLTIISWGMALIAGRVIRSTVLSGPSAPFVLELPPYRTPTLKGIMIHTWERTWMYVKKAGTVILAVSIVIWAMMTFPSLPAERERFFDEKKSELRKTFLAVPEVGTMFSGEKALEEFEALLPTMEAGKPIPAGLPPGWQHLALRVAAEKHEKKETSPGVDSPEIERVAKAYADYKEAAQKLDQQSQQERLRHTLAGRIGTALEVVTRPLGFDWRVNVALIGGFAAKEVIVATLGTAYSLGQVEPDSSTSLAERLRNEPGWNPVVAFSLIMFVMLYNPCFTTLVVLKRESGKWRWTLFAMMYTTTLAYIVAFLVYSGGRLLGLGI